MRTGSLPALASLLAALAVAGCSDDDGAPLDAAVDAGPDAATYPIPEPVAPWNPCTALDEHPAATVVTVHDAVHHFWTGWDAGQNARVLDAEADLPEGGSWRRVFLKVTLECPTGARCDAWDRSAAISLVVDPGEAERPLELSRYMTPYGVGMCYVADVTHFVSQLKGRRTFRSFVDTWVGPGHSDGDGWQVTTTLIYHPGVPDPSWASEVIPLWNNNAEDRITDLGDPGKTVAEQHPARTVTIPADAQGAALWFLVSGHGQGNLNNCAEWCTLTRTVRFGNAEASYTPDRNDCPANPVSNQGGNWQPSRDGGWCPGAWVIPELVDITANLAAGQDFVFEYDVTDGQGATYENPCRPEAGDASNICSGCTFNQNAGNCDWDWSMHTPPYERVAVQLLIFR